jgi:hypothetical protein
MGRQSKLPAGAWMRRDFVFVLGVPFSFFF